MVLAKELLNQTSHELTLAQDRMGVLGKLDATERLARTIFLSMYSSSFFCSNTHTRASPIASAQ